MKSRGTRSPRKRRNSDIQSSDVDAGSQQKRQTSASNCEQDGESRLLRKALVINQKLLEKLRAQLQQIDARTAEIDKAEAALLDNSSESSTYQSWNLLRWIDEHDGSVPEDNLDTQIEIALYGKPLRVELMNSPQHWSLSEHENLEKATVLRNNLTRFNLQSGEIGPGDDHTSDSLVESLDWDGVASFVGTRTASNCKREWTVNRLPLLQGLADRPFSNTELEDLKWAERHWRGRHWDEIAVYVGNGRRPIECLREYQAKLNLEHMRPWTKEEDRALVNAVTNDPPQRGQWGKIALLFVGRTVPQCRSRWNSLTHSEKTGTWTQDEDEQLKTAVVRHGRGDWVQVAKHVEGRSAHQCRERYERRLKLGVRRKWRVEDYEKLRHLVMTPGARLEWSRLAESMQTSGPHVRDIYATLKKKGYFQEPPASAALTYVAKKDAAAKNC